MEHNEKKQTERVYEKPAVKRIELSAGEVLGIGCKVQAGLPGTTSVCADAFCVLTLGS